MLTCAVSCSCCLTSRSVSFASSDASASVLAAPDGDATPCSLPSRLRLRSPALLSAAALSSSVLELRSMVFSFAAASFAAAASSGVAAAAAASFAAACFFAAACSSGVAAASAASAVAAAAAASRLRRRGEGLTGVLSVEYSSLTAAD